MIDDIPPTEPVATPRKFMARGADPAGHETPVVTTVAPSARVPGGPTDGPDGYDLADEVGRGGMGVVYRARDIAMKREVAVKLLQSDFPTNSETADRFIEEAQITGQLQHPGIPAVYRVGRTPAGRPFLAMKLIRGDTLSFMVKNAAKFNPLAVFEGVCQTLAYAHSHRIIHRDLKPANIMVGAFGEVQVMDWGLAKTLASGGRQSAVEPSRDATTALITNAAGTTIADADPNATVDAVSSRAATQAGSVMGTPAFMPPEQAAGEIDKIDCRSDVFGLGAILCVLLTNEPPYRGESAKAVMILAIRGQTADALARLDASAAEPGLVALCKRCLSFAPADRPADAAAVAAEVAALRQAAEDRAKDAELGAARAEVRAAEQAKRRRAVQWAAGAVAAVLLLGVAGTTIGLLRANAAREAAEGKRLEAVAAREAEEKQKVIAQENEAAAEATVQFFQQHVFIAAQPKGHKGGLRHDVTLRETITASLPALTSGFTNQPLVEARLRMTLGITFAYLGDAKTAAGQAERARAIYAERKGPDHSDTLDSMNNLANDYDDMNREAEALTLREDVLAVRRRVHPADHPDTLRSMNNLALSYADMNRPAEALKLREDILAARKRTLPPDHADTLSSMSTLAGSYAALNRPAEALKLREETLAIQKRVLPWDDPDTLLSMANLAESYADMNRPADALKLDEETLAARKRVLPPDHPDTLKSLNNLAVRYATLNRPADALILFEETLAARRRVLPPDHPAVLRSMHNLATSYAAMKRPADALKLHEETLAARKRILPPDHPDTLKGMHNLALNYAAMKRPADALKLHEETLAARKRVLPPDHPDTLASMWGLAETLIQLGRGKEAIPVIDECISRSAGQVVHPRMISSVVDMRFRHFEKVGDAGGCRETATMWEKLDRKDAGSLYDAACMRAIAAVLYAASDTPAEAAADADRAMAWLAKAVAAGYKDGAHMAKDDDLAFLRKRADFRKLVASITPRPVAPAPRRG